MDAHPRQSPDLGRLQEILDSTMSWPGEYTFKFIVPRAAARHLVALLGELPFTERSSRAGRYIAVTVAARMDSSAAVIALYRRTAAVKGLIAL
jgi:putative lipoic acid-binding regulatory protein